MNSQELETAKRIGANITVVVWRDDGYGLIDWKQRNEFGRPFGVEFGNPDFVDYARSFGIAGFRPSSAADLAADAPPGARRRRPVARRGPDRLPREPPPDRAPRGARGRRAASARHPRRVAAPAALSPGGQAPRGSIHRRIRRRPVAETLVDRVAHRARLEDRDVAARGGPIGGDAGGHRRPEALAAGSLDRGDVVDPDRRAGARPEPRRDRPAIGVADVDGVAGPEPGVAARRSRGACPPASRTRGPPSGCDRPSRPGRRPGGSRARPGCVASEAGSGGAPFRASGSSSGGSTSPRACRSARNSIVGPPPEVDDEPLPALAQRTDGLLDHRRRRVLALDDHLVEEPDRQPGGRAATTPSRRQTRLPGPFATPSLNVSIMFSCSRRASVASIHGGQ